MTPNTTHERQQDLVDQNADRGVGQRQYGRPDNLGRRGEKS